MEDVLAIIVSLIIIYGFYELFTHFIIPTFIEKKTKIIEKNPKWIKDNMGYYGFQDIDITLVENPYTEVRRMKVITNKSKNIIRYEFMIPSDTLTKDVDEIVRLAIMAKIQAKYGLFFPEKPTHWLSILCYMLDGGDINQEAVSWENKKK